MYAAHHKKTRLTKSDGLATLHRAKPHNVKAKGVAGLNAQS
ncbi:hypothetical protein [Acetobacter orientalis]|nr:hypothetical protein [Acetobacter orientalis]